MLFSRLFIYLAIIMLLLLLFFMYPGRTTITLSDPLASVTPSSPEALQDLAPKEKKDKWIVITTINPPTDAMRKFASLPEWQLLVVGDEKTPNGWHVDGAIFLSLAHQKALKYRINKHIPLKSYARKNIGYLYAIQQGAKIIYESDDDNIPTTDIVILPESSKGYLYTGHSDSLNPYAHFGYPHIWPRGFPLGAIAEDSMEDLSPSLSHTDVCIPVQQGLANKDPDVDAIWRLTQSHLIGKVEFTAEQTPLVLSPGTFSPYNTQNTVQHYSAFWGLLLPVTTSFRVCDIWRGYWAQRVLWEFGCTLSFTQPIVEQIRNAHDYFKDFLEEEDLYFKAGPLVRFLMDWVPSEKASTLPKIISQLAADMAAADFWKQGDSVLIDAWLEDLKDIGYRFPEVKRGWQEEWKTPKSSWKRPTKTVLTLEEKEIQQLTSTIDQLKSQIKAKEEEVKRKEEEILEKEGKVTQKNDLTLEKDKLIQEKEEELRSFKESFEKGAQKESELENQLQEKDSKIHELEQALEKLKNNPPPGQSSGEAPQKEEAPKEEEKVPKEERETTEEEAPKKEENGSATKES